MRLKGFLIAAIGLFLTANPIFAQTSPPQAQPEHPEMHFLRSSIDVQLYGYIKLDVAFDTASISNGDFARWVESEANRHNDPQINITANQTRLGLNFSGPSAKSMTTSGRLEMDFYGGGTENKPIPMMRHAYLLLTWPQLNLSLLAGQTSDVISPLYPNTLNYTVAWWAGNIGYRRPQLRVSKDFGSTDILTLQLAISRTVGDANPFGPPADTGEASGIPTTQARIAYTFPMLSKKATIGISGHYGKDEYDIDPMGHCRHFESWSGNGELILPLWEKIEFRGEMFYGQNMDEYLGGIGQGINLKEMREIRDLGGWGQFALGPFGKWTFDLGGSADDPNDNDLNPGDRSLNIAYWGNCLYDITRAVQVGLEGSYWVTNYKFGELSDSYRGQASFIYKF
jgi:hypothetical protein